MPAPSPFAQVTGPWSRILSLRGYAGHAKPWTRECFGAARKPDWPAGKNLPAGLPAPGSRRSRVPVDDHVGPAGAVLEAEQDPQLLADPVSPALDRRAPSR